MTEQEGRAEIRVQGTQNIIDIMIGRYSASSKMCLFEWTFTNVSALQGNTTCASGNTSEGTRDQNWSMQVGVGCSNKCNMHIGMIHCYSVPMCKFCVIATRVCSVMVVVQMYARIVMILVSRQTTSSNHFVRSCGHFLPFTLNKMAGSGSGLCQRRLA